MGHPEIAVLARLLGRRSRAASLPAHPGADADGVARVFPKELFQGETGAFLRELGFSPDDPANILPTQTAAQAKSDVLKRELDALVASVNDELGGVCTVLPWAMVPWSVWNREPAEFMMGTCDFYPASRWNTMLLPADAASAERLGLPVHPRTPIDGLEDAAAKVFTELSEAYAAEQANATRASGRKGPQGLATTASGPIEVRAQAVGIARHFGHAVFGDAAAQRHHELFREILWSKA